MTKNFVSEGADRFWYGYLTRAHRDVVPPEDTWPWSQTLSNAAFSAGARWAIRQSSELSPHIAKFIEMMILLGLVESDEEFFSMPDPLVAVRADAQGNLDVHQVPIEFHTGEDAGVVVEQRDDIPF